MSNANKFTEKGTITIAAHQGQENGRDWVTLCGRRHRHRHDTGADGKAVPGVLPGFFLYREQVRWYGPWARDQQTLLSDDGR